MFPNFHILDFIELADQGERLQESSVIMIKTDNDNEQSVIRASNLNSIQSIYHVLEMTGDLASSGSSDRIIRGFRMPEKIRSTSIDQNHDPFWCPSPILGNDESKANHTQSDGLQFTNSTSESAILKCTSNIFGGQYSPSNLTHNISQKCDKSSASEDMVDSPPIVQRSRRKIKCKTIRQSNILVSPSVSVVNETVDDDDGNDIHKKKKKYNRNSNNNTFDQRKGFAQKFMRKKKIILASPATEGRQALSPYSTSLSSSTPIKDEKPQHGNRQFDCALPLAPDLECRCLWHHFQVDYVSDINGYPISTKVNFSYHDVDWLSRHQPLMDTDKMLQKKKDRQAGISDKLSTTSGRENLTLNLTRSINQPIRTVASKWQNMDGEKLSLGSKLERNFSDPHYLKSQEVLTRERWIRSSDFCSCPVQGDQSVLILNYLKIRDFYTTSDVTSSTSPPSFHFFRFCYSSLPQFSSFDYDYRLEWSDSDRVDHYRLAHPIFIPNSLKWIPLLTHPDGAIVFCLKQND